MKKYGKKYNEVKKKVRRSIDEVYYYYSSLL